MKLRAGRSGRVPPVVAWFVFLLAVAGSAGGYGEHVWNANSQSSGLNYFVDVTRSAAQSFTPVESFVLQNVTLNVENVGISQTDVLSVTIRTDSAGSPSGTILGGSSQARAGSGWLDFPFSPDITLTAGATYWIVATNGELAAMGYGWFHANQDLVPGVAKVNLGLGWLVTDNTDLTYITYGVRLQPKITVGVQASAPTVDPGEVTSLSIYLNNTGNLAAPTSWVNVTFPPEVTYESDTVAALGGSKTGPSEWTIPGLGNGPHSFTVDVRAGSAVGPGTRVTISVHLDHSNGLGGAEPPSTADATFFIGLKEKPLYLAHNGAGDRLEDLHAAPPGGPLLDFDSDSDPGLTLDATPGNEARWTLAPSIARDFRLKGPVRVDLYLDSRAPSDNVGFRLEILDRGMSVTTITASSRTAAFDGSTGWQLFSFAFGNVDYLVPRGNEVELAIVNEFGGDAFVAYNAPAVPSRVRVLTHTYIAFDQVLEEDDQGPAGLFSTRDTVHVRANVSDPLGSGEIAGVTIDMTDPDGLPIATAVSLSLVATESGPLSAWKLFTHSLATPAKEGTYSYLLKAREGNGLEQQRQDSFLVRIPVLDLEAAVSPLNPTPLDFVMYTLYANNSGQGTAKAWFNASIPSGLSYVSDTSGASGGAKTGDYNWSFPSVPPGPFGFTIVVQVDSIIPGGTVLTSQIGLEYADEKEFAWTSPSVDATVVVTGVRLTVELGLAPSAVHPGEALTVSVWFNNTGNAVSPDLWLNLSLPASITYVSDTAGALPEFTSSDTSANPIRYRFSNVGIGSHGFTISLVAGPLTPGDLLDFLAVLDYALHVGGGTVRSTDSATAIAAGPILTPGVTGPSLADPGDAVNLVLAYNNTGTEAAQSVWVNLTWGPALVFGSSIPPPFSQVGGAATWYFPSATLGPHSISVALTMTVGQADSTLVQVRESIDYADAQGGFYSSPEALHVVRVTAPVFAYALTSQVVFVEGGDVVMFTLSYVNAGTGIAANVWVNLTLSDSLTFLNDDASVPETVAGALRIWRFQDVVQGSHGFRVNASVNMAVVHGDMLTTDAGFSATDANGNALASDSEAYTHVVSTSRVTAGISVVPTVAPQRSPVAYTIYVNNTGGRAAAMVWINDTFDPRFTFLGDNSGLSKTIQGNLISWVRPNLAASERVTFEATVQLAASANVGDFVPNDVAAEFTNAGGLRIGVHRSPQVLVEVLDGTDPTANAGPDQIVAFDPLGTSVTFDGTGSTDNVAVVNYTWTFSLGATFYALYGPTPSHVFNAVATVVVTLTVRDAAGYTNADTVTIAVRDMTDPVADAGPDQIVEAGTAVDFNGGGSTDNLGVVNYTWTFSTGGPSYTKDGPTPSHVFREVDTVVVTLRVRDAAGNSDTDVVIITVRDTRNPVANAGPDQTVEIGATGATVTFDGTGSTDNGRVVNYTWTFMIGPTPHTLYGATPSRVIPITGTFIVTLTVRDATGNVDTDTMSITVQDSTSPIARAGPDQTVEVGTTVSLDGAGSSDLVGIVNYTWTFVAGGQAYTKYGAIAGHRFTSVGVVLVTLTVRDAVENVGMDTVAITVQDTTRPTANAGADQTVELGEAGVVVLLNGTGSFDNVEVANHTWTFTVGGTRYTLYGRTTNHEFTAAGTVVVTLTVTDDSGNTASDSVTITVRRATASAGLLGNPGFLGLLVASIAAPSAALWYWRYRRPSIEKVLLVTKDGLLLYHVSRTLGSPGEKDEDLLSGMLTVVQDFVKDAFNYSANRELDTVEFGDYNVIIERGEHVFLAVVISGKQGSDEVRKKAQRTIGEIEVEFGETLENWKGDMDRIAGVRDIVRRLLARR